MPEMRLIQEYEALMAVPDKDQAALSRIQVLEDEIAAADAWSYEHRIQAVLSRLGVNFLDKTIATLSGGQQKRVALAQVMIEEPDLLIMDEPTNHLDLPAIEWMEKQLSSAKQSLVLVTHDRYFLDAITDEIMELDRGELHMYKGNYSYFLQKKDEREAPRRPQPRAGQEFVSHRAGVVAPVASRTYHQIQGPHPVGSYPERKNPQPARPSPYAIRSAAPSHWGQGHGDQKAAQILWVTCPLWTILPIPLSGKSA